MRLAQYRNKWIVYGEDGYIIIMTSHKGIALHHLKKHLNSNEK